MDRIALFQKCLKAKGLKNTSQRMLILESFLESKWHYSTEELYLKLRKEHPHIGYATIHRTLKLFAECGIAAERNFGDGQTRFEPCHDESHHDHLVCTTCGRIIEFAEPRIEKLQEQVGVRYNFYIQSHRHELYGLCSNCCRQDASPGV